MNRLPFVLLPGLLCSPRLYAPQLPLLWQHGPVAVADTRHADSMSAMAAQMLADAPPRFGLLGLSMGGYLAFEILRQAPERVALLVLMDTSARPDTAEATANRHAQVAQARAGEFQSVVDGLYARLVAPSRAQDEALRQVVTAMAQEVGVDAFARQQAAIIGRADARPLLPSVRCPTLVLVGEQDQITPPALAEEIRQGIPDAECVVLPDTGHLSTLESPQAVNTALARWLAAQLAT
ncbi:alpha/beta fold hydrolase [Verticiella sediminum]|uniref:Alpha/beta fold hydrolase n=1 Tax=Verticiella sediminum TaxID=1247510 RepID=A0A556A9J2_9BURK|nr:alpha/beta fold hydrolase [Verticiella sediminum]TSH89556.1 alpha/beta fold hydrolase [Verticiella sediminum]